MVPASSRARAEAAEAELTRLRAANPSSQIVAELEERAATLAEAAEEYRDAALDYTYAVVAGGQGTEPFREARRLADEALTAALSALDSTTQKTEETRNG